MFEIHGYFVHGIQLNSADMAQIWQTPKKQFF